MVGKGLDQGLQLQPSSAVALQRLEVSLLQHT